MRERIFAQDVSSCFNCLFSANTFAASQTVLPPSDMEHRSWTCPVELEATGKGDWRRGSERSSRGAEVGFWRKEVMRVAGKKGRGEIRPSMLSGECLPRVFECPCSCGLGFLLLSPPLFHQPKSSDLNGHSQ